MRRRIPITELTGRKVSIVEDHEVRDWCTRFGVTGERLRAAIDRVGYQAPDVARELHRL